MSFGGTYTGYITLCSYCFRFFEPRSAQLFSLKAVRKITPGRVLSTLYYSFPPRCSSRLSSLSSPHCLNEQSCPPSARAIPPDVSFTIIVLPIVTKEAHLVRLSSTRSDHGRSRSPRTHHRLPDTQGVRLPHPTQSIRQSLLVALPLSLRARPQHVPYLPPAARLNTLSPRRPTAPIHRSPNTRLVSIRIPQPINPQAPKILMQQRFVRTQTQEG